MTERCTICGEAADQPRVIQTDDTRRVFCQSCWERDRQETLEELTGGNEKALRILENVLETYNAIRIEKDETGLNVTVIKKGN